MSQPVTKAIKAQKGSLCTALLFMFDTSSALAFNEAISVISFKSSSVAQYGLQAPVVST